MSDAFRSSDEFDEQAHQLYNEGRYDEALIEFQIASDLNPTDSTVEAAVRDARKRLKAKLALERPGKTELQSLVERSRTLPPAGTELPDDVKLPDSLVFRNASSRMILTAIARFADLNIVFDPGFRDVTLTAADLRKMPLAEAGETVFVIGIEGERRLEAPAGPGIFFPREVGVRHADVQLD